MPIIVRLDELMARRKIRLNELASRIDITEANLSILKTGKARAIRFSTLEALCAALDCQPGDLLEFQVSEKMVEGNDESEVVEKEDKKKGQSGTDVEVCL